MPFDGKTGAILGASAGVIGTARSQRDLRWIMSGLNVYMVNLPHIYVGNAAQKFDAAGKLTDQAARDFIKQLLDNLRDLTLRLRPR
jgi:chromate reductase